MHQKMFGGIVMSLVVVLVGSGCAVSFTTNTPPAPVIPSAPETITTSSPPTTPVPVVKPSVASVVTKKPNQSLKTWLAGFSTRQQSIPEIDLKKYKPIFQIMYGIPDSDAGKAVILYSDAGWKDGAEHTLYFGVDESDMGDDLPHYVFYGPYRDRVNALVAEARNYRDGESIVADYLLSGITWYQN